MASPALPTAEELADMLARLEDLKFLMAQRSAGGADLSGRYKKHDTARKNYINAVALPGLRWGRMPPAADVRLLFLPGDDEISDESEIAEMDAFYQKHKKDPRQRTRVRISCCSG